jgi:hypothetical protein
VVSFEVLGVERRKEKVSMFCLNDSCSNDFHVFNWPVDMKGKGISVGKES